MVTVECTDALKRVSQSIDSLLNSYPIDLQALEQLRADAESVILESKFETARLRAAAPKLYDALSLSSLLRAESVLLRALSRAAIVQRRARSLAS